jgi:hypothetical protein
MSSSAHRIVEKDRKANSGPTETTAAKRQAHEVFLLSLIERNRFAVFATPFCLAGVMILLETFGGQRFHDVINFLVRIPQ